MAKQEVAFDPELFSRTATLFALKRTSFAPKAVEVLAEDVLRRLATGVKRETHADLPVMSKETINAFCEALICTRAEPSQRFIEDRRAEGVTRMGVYLGYICAAAQRLGEGWENDQYSFIDVTIGTGHLYAIMRALRDERAQLPLEFDAKRCALFATVPGEDHGIGITVAANYFRENGWEIDLQIGTDFDGLIEHVEQTEPSIIGLSLSTEARFDMLVRMVVAMRLIVPHAIIGVAPAAGLNAQRIRDLADIDLVFGRADSAASELERLIRIRA